MLSNVMEVRKELTSWHAPHTTFADREFRVLYTNENFADMDHKDHLHLPGVLCGLEAVGRDINQPRAKKGKTQNF